MAFTFTADLSDDIALVRFHCGDTDENGYYLEDATITALVAAEGSTSGAAIAAIRYIIMQLSRPDFKADWLTVTNKAAREGYQQLLKDKCRELGVNYLSATATHAHRADSYATEEPDYSEGT